MTTPSGASPIATPPSAPDPAAPKKNGAKTWIIAAAVTALVAVGIAIAVSRGGDDSSDGSAPVAAAGSGDEQTGGPQPGGAAGRFAGRGATGTIEAISADGLTLDSDGETIDVRTTAETTVTEAVEGSLSDLATGDRVSVRGETSGDGVAASSITALGAGDGFGPGGGGRPEGGFPEGGPPQGGTLPNGDTIPEGGMPGRPGRGGGATMGTIESIEGNTVTLTTSDDETVAVTVSDDTQIMVTKELTVADLVEGETVVVMGETSDDVLTAVSIRRGEPGAGPGGRGFPGGPPAGN